MEKADDATTLARMNKMIHRMRQLRELLIGAESPLADDVDELRQELCDIRDIQERKVVKRYGVFCYEGYYPCGGIEDYKDSFDTIEEARQFILGREHRNEYEDIVDLWRMESVECK